jgi:catechol 2,3-dioxygenase-like lactoylglutathione lyase family enzyme
VSVSEEHPNGDPEAKAPYGGVMWKGSEPGKRTSVEAWWRRWPNALIGVDIGALRILVADVDGAHSIAPWEAYADEHGGLPDGVPYVNTPTGGRHYFFRLPDGVNHGNGRGSLPPKAELPVDIRGIGGFVIAAGTERPYHGRYEPHDGNPFSWLDAPEIPAWLLTVLKGEREHQEEPQAKLPAITPSAPVTVVNPRVRAWAEAAFEDEIGAVSMCGEGGRNNQLNASAFALGQFIPQFLDESRVRSALEQAAQDCGVWKDDGPPQCRKTINSGISKGNRDPRPIPADIIEDEAEAEEGRAIRLRLAAKWQNAKAAAAALVPHDPETGEVLDEPEPEPEPVVSLHGSGAPWVAGTLEKISSGSPVVAELKMLW